MSINPSIKLIDITDFIGSVLCVTDTTKFSDIEERTESVALSPLTSGDTLSTEENSKGANRLYTNWGIVADSKPLKTWLKKGSSFMDPWIVEAGRMKGIDTQRSTEL